MLGNNYAPMEEPQAPMNEPQDSMNGNEIDNSFENDEDKTEIQSLTGKLSQKLMSYNQSNHDKELSKYVGGMIIPQAAKELDSDEREKLAKKVIDADTSEMDSQVEEPIQQGQQQQQMESVRRFGKKTLDEIINDVMDDVTNSKYVPEKGKIDKVQNNKFARNPFKSKFK